ncbi:MAG: conjugal transfer protein TraH [Pseudomonadota bacterium]
MIVFDRSMRRGRSAVIATLIAALTVPASPASAGMREQMTSMFNNMVNATPPGFYETQRRGEISGGNLYVRNRIVDPNLVAFTPPNFRAGCGGIDFFTGSFSFINADQFVELMRAVASNAVGYAFQLALDGVCPQCMRTIETLQRKVQELNQHFGNSCQLAQGIVNDTASALTGKKYGEASTIATVEGIGDVFESWSTSTGQSPTEAVAASAPDEMEERLTGNLVWRALKSSSVDDWFEAGGDDEILSIMMTISGTVIVDYDAGADSFEIATINGDPGLIESWIDGSVTRYMSCVGEGADGCLAPAMVESDWGDEGFAQAVFHRLTDPDTGALRQMRDGGLDAPTRSLVAALPGSTGAYFVRLASISEQAAITFAREAAFQLALELTAQMVRDLHAAAQRAAGTIEDGYSVKVAEVMAAAVRANDAEIARLQRKHGNLAELMRIYEGFFLVMQPEAETSLASFSAE